VVGDSQADAASAASPESSDLASQAVNHFRANLSRN